MDKPKNKNFANTASRISAIASSVMDLHVRIALQEKINKWGSIYCYRWNFIIVSFNMYSYYFLSHS